MAGKKLPSILYLFIWIGFSFISPSAAAKGFCDHPIQDEQINAHFEKLALKQMALEFGSEGLELYGTQHENVGPDLVRVEAFLKFRKPGRVDFTTMRIKGWISRCMGTLIIQGNTWLADGTLAVPRYTPEELQGKGLILGKPDAPTRIIAFVDSRCPQCHKLIGYARELIKDGKIRIELRQTAFLEPAEEAIKDTRLFETRVVMKGKPIVDDADYLEMLGEFNSDADVDVNSTEYKQGLSIINANTKTARDVLHLTTVPGVLLMDDAKMGAYRLTSYWEMNRLFQPDL